MCGICGVAGGDCAIEPEQHKQGAAPIRRQFRFNAECAAPERIEIDPAQRRDLGRCCEHGAAAKLRRVEIELGVRDGAIGSCFILVEIERQFKARGTRIGPHRVEP